MQSQVHSHRVNSLTNVDHWTERGHDRTIFISPYFLSIPYKSNTSWYDPLGTIIYRVFNSHFLAPKTSVFLFIRLRYTLLLTSLVLSCLPIVGLESIAMFGSFGLFAVWCIMV